MKKSKKSAERKSIREKLIARARQIDEAHRIKKEKLLKNIEIEYFAPALAAVVFVILLAVLVVFLAEHYFLGYLSENPETEIAAEESVIFESDLSLEALISAENLQVLPRPRIISSGEILDFAEKLAYLPKNKLFAFEPSELPTRQIFNTLQIVAVRARNTEHLLSTALAQVQALRDLYNIDIRTETLKINEGARAFFLNAHLTEIVRELSVSQGLQLALNHMRTELETNFNFKKAQYETHLAQYNSALEAYNGNQAEFAMRDLASEKSEMEALSQKYEAYGSVLTRLQDYSVALEKKRQVIESNFDALVAGVQVTFDSAVDLGLIQQ